MLFDRVVGNIESNATGSLVGRAWDVLDLTWRECARRAVRGRSRAGRDVGILLPPGVTLRHGDALAAGAAGDVLVISVIPCDVWVAEFSDPSLMAAAALELGNLHVPAEVGSASSLLTLPDGPVRGVLDRYATSWRPEVRRFQPLRATTTAGALGLADGFRVNRARAAPGADPERVSVDQVTNSRE